MTKPLCIGIYGGTFDPIHNGHLRVAEELVDLIGLDQLFFVPAGEPRLRNAPVASAYHRAQMVSLSIQDNANFFLDDREIKRSGVSTTVESLQEYRAEYGEQAVFCFIMGADAFIKIHHWYCWRELFQLCHLIVVERPNSQRVSNCRELPQELQSICTPRWVSDVGDMMRQFSGMIYIAKTALLDISATRIRNYVAADKSIRYLLPEVVSDYIKTHHLYSGTHGIK